MDPDIGIRIYELAKELFPIHRSITGNGVRDTLRILQRELPDLAIHEVPSGTQCFDWIVPPEWNIRDSFIVGPDDQKFAKFSDSNLHVLGYSVPIDATVSLDELQEHLYSLPDQPNAIPYTASFYEERWGFCITHEQREHLKPGDYRVFIDSTLAPGYLTYGELILKGKSDQEVLLSTNICHPSLANNELSGPTVTTFLAQWLGTIKQRRYTYRVLFIPETIGSIVYLSEHVEHLQQHVVAGFQIICVGDDRSYSYVPSRQSDTLADRVALHVLKHLAPEFRHYSFLDRTSDERQYCSPGVDLPVVSVMRTKPGEYPEYHTSLDDLTVVTPAGLFGGYEVLRRCLECLEGTEVLSATVRGEPQLGRRGLYATLMGQTKTKFASDMMNLLAYCDGRRDLLEISDSIGVAMWELLEPVERLKREGLLTPVAAEQHR